MKRNNKIFQSSFGIPLQPIIPATKTGCPINKKWLFWEKKHFLFSVQAKNMSLSLIAKNGSKTPFQLILAFVLLNQKSKSDFSQKKYCLFIGYNTICVIFILQNCNGSGCTSLCFVAYLDAVMILSLILYVSTNSINYCKQEPSIIVP